MHQSSFDLMKILVEKYIPNDSTLEVIDIGSLDVNGCYKPIFEKLGCKYYGADLKEGKNVDIKLKEPDNWNIIKQFDVVISGQVLEHVEDIYRFARQTVEISKKYVICIAPNTCKEHNYPIDCYRFFPAGMRYLFNKREKLKELECGTRGMDTYYIGCKL